MVAQLALLVLTVRVWVKPFYPGTNVHVPLGKNVADDEEEVKSEEECKHKV